LEEERDQIADDLYGVAFDELDMEQKRKVLSNIKLKNAGLR
jgi:hypothetical protein